LPGFIPAENSGLNDGGKIKISRELSKRQIDDSFIRSAINEIDQDEYLKLLEELLRKKSKEIKTDDTFILIIN